MLRLLIFITISLLYSGTAPGVDASDTQMFSGQARSTDFLSTPSTDTLPSQTWGLYMWLDHATNTLPYFIDDSGSEETSSFSIDNTVTSAHVGAGYGITPKWDFHLGISNVVDQTRNDKSSPHGAFARNGVTGFKFSSRYRLLKAAGWGVAWEVGLFHNSIKSNPFFRNRTNIPMTAINVDWQSGPYSFATQLGYRFRKQIIGDTEVGRIREIGDQTIAKAAFGYQVNPRGKAMAEVYSAYTTVDRLGQTKRKASIMELAAGYRHWFTNNNYAVTGGLARELIHSANSADIRFLVGVHALLKPPPAPAPAKKSERNGRTKLVKTIVVLSEVLFDFDSAKIKPGARTALNKVARAIENTPRFSHVIIEGHTCSLGSHSYNQRLSNRRSAAARRALHSMFQTRLDQLRSVGFGEEQPRHSNSTEAQRRKNRRVEFNIYSFR